MAEHNIPEITPSCPVTPCSVRPSPNLSYSSTVRYDMIPRIRYKYSVVLGVLNLGVKSVRLQTVNLIRNNKNSPQICCRRPLSNITHRGRVEVLVQTVRYRTVKAPAPYSGHTAGCQISANTLRRNRVRVQYEYRYHTVSQPKTCEKCFLRLHHNHTKTVLRTPHPYSRTLSLRERGCLAGLRDAGMSAN